ncbi:MAG: InlB B-repeat-containing protein [Gaiellaceae bacterium]
MRRALAAAGALAALVSVGGAAAEGGGEPGGHGLTLRTTTRSDVRAFASGPARAAATWCGSASTEDRSPNAVAGHPVHWVYAIPSDGADRLAELANAMQTDAEQIDAWWRSQDTARAPRNDVTQFPCGLQLDITTVRMAETGAQLAPLSGRFAAVFNTLGAARLRSSFTKYVVYYDGPVSDTEVCGQGASDPSGLGLAVVYFQSCVGVSTAAVGAHELLHTFGAVARGAPNECPESSGHTCDDSNDLMYPSIDDAPLSAKSLDPGRNDYYGHGGSWPDAQDSAWLVHLDNQAPLALTMSGPGAIASDVPGLVCSQSCATTWNAGTRLALTATPGPGARLVRWGSPCAGASGCTVTVSSGSSVSALFAPASFRLTVSVSGRGAVRSTQPGITCRPRCSGTFPSYSPVTLVATPAKGWRFRSWRGGCRGAKRSCRVPMTAVTSARAVFVRI